MRADLKRAVTRLVEAAERMDDRDAAAALGAVLGELRRAYLSRPAGFDWAVADEAGMTLAEQIDAMNADIVRTRLWNQRVIAAWRSEQQAVDGHAAWAASIGLAPHDPGSKPRACARCREVRAARPEVSVPDGSMPDVAAPIGPDEAQAWIALGALLSLGERVGADGSVKDAAVSLGAAIDELRTRRDEETDA